MAQKLIQNGEFIESGREEPRAIHGVPFFIELPVTEGENKIALGIIKIFGRFYLCPAPKMKSTGKRMAFYDKNTSCPLVLKNLKSNIFQVSKEEYPIVEELFGTGANANAYLARVASKITFRHPNGVANVNDIYYDMFGDEHYYQANSPFTGVQAVWQPGTRNGYWLAQGPGPLEIKPKILWYPPKYQIVEDMIVWKTEVNDLFGFCPVSLYGRSGEGYGYAMIVGDKVEANVDGGGKNWCKYFSLASTSDPHAISCALETWIRHRMSVKKRK